MKEQENLNYKRIELAIRFITENFKSQPTLDAVAEHIHLSPAHFQRLFKDFAGVSPKKFLQYISLEHAKSLLKEKQLTLFDTTLETGLSATSRLHDLFVTIEGMTPAEYKNGGKNLSIKYSFAETDFGRVIVASTEKGICFIAFHEDKSIALEDLRSHFPEADFSESEKDSHKNALKLLTSNENLPTVKLHLKGTDFQLKVWEALLKIPSGELSTYGSLAKEINQPNASRAVGTAIGSNPVAFLIPCHRVIQSTGNFGGYMWGPIRKTALIGWESSKTYGE